MTIKTVQPLLNVDIDQISIAERIQLAEDLWDSILSTPEAVTVTEPQQQELDRRLGQYSQTPEAGSSWQVVKERLSNL
ncbi:addiction module protein [Synechococcus sp. PCC 7336]|uniref:addiction module protein n=1 Tax=Synechococcus sp. PCC 7336 TaxID=195250 RepID=UPI000363D9FE|nr:addiction module protein [Synechococcus sp. PCC 7336]